MKVSDLIGHGSFVSCGPHERNYESKAVRLVPTRRSVKSSKPCVPWTFLTSNIRTNCQTKRLFTETPDAAHAQRQSGQPAAGVVLDPTGAVHDEEIET